jgi:hypothetical protein
VVEATLTRPRRRSGLVAVWAALGVLAAVIAVGEYLDRRPPASRSVADARLLLPVPVEQLGALEIADAGRLHRFERDPTGAWFYHGVHAGPATAHTHRPDPALAQRIERAVAAFGRARVERQFPLDNDGSPYGLATPDLLVLVYRPEQSQPLAQYAVGAVAPDTASRYVMVVGRPGVVTIPNYQIDNLLALVKAASEAQAASAATDAAPLPATRR